MPDKYWILAIGGAIVLIGIGSNLKIGSVDFAGPGKKAGAVAGALGAVIALVGLAYAVWPQWIGLPPEPRPTVTMTVAPTPTPLPEPASFKFAGVPRTVPLCFTFAGVGKIRDKQSVILFDHPLGNSSADYYFDGVGKFDGTSWTFSQVTVGEPDDAGVHVEMVAVIVDEEVAKYVESIDSGSDEAWLSSALPGPPADRVEVERNSVSTPCQ